MDLQDRSTLTITTALKPMKDVPDTTTTTTCANCGPQSAGDLKTCKACKLVNYCNRECQIAHRPLHKRKRAAEMYDEALFKKHPPRVDCPICFLPLPLHAKQTTFKPCCGKLIWMLLCQLLLRT